MGDGDDLDELTFARSVSGFYLDRFEVTVGRFRTFQANYVLPTEGQGAHPLVAGTGWDESWEQLPHDFADGRTAVPSSKDDLVVQITDDCSSSTWVDGNPELPINCVNWYVAFAFCVYDGGRLPTEAEWNYAAAFGDAQRPYPWSESSSDLSIEEVNATFYAFPTPAPTFPTTVGSKPGGRGGFLRHAGDGHDDLGGNVFEWVLDGWLEEAPASCSDCVVDWSGGTDRVVRGGGFESDYSFLRSGSRSSLAAAAIEPIRGFRCARDVNTGGE